jgi:hypothetical protein
VNAIDREQLELWQVHARRCSSCKRVDLDKPATLALTCLEGARLFKDVAAIVCKQVEEGARR